MQPIIFTLKEVEDYSIDKNRLKYKVLICHKQKEELKGTNVLKYIEYGEERGRGFQKRPTCDSRSPWYALGKGWNYAPLIFPAKVGERMPVFLNDNVFEDKKLYGVTPKNKEDTILLGAFLNSTVSRLIIEHTCRQLTGAQAIADIDVVVMEQLIIPDPLELSKKIRAKLENSFRELSETSCDSIFEEIGANSPEEVFLDKIKPDRRELDKIVMGEILGLTEEEQLEVYRAVVDLVKSRLEKAGSVPKQAKRKGVDIGALAEGILREIDTSELKKFPGDYIGDEECREIEVPKGKPEVGSDLHGFFVKIGDARIVCGSQEEAKYIEFAVMNGNTRIRSPKDEREIKKAVESYGSVYNKLKKDVFAYTRRTIQNNKLREQVEAVVWEKITKHNFVLSESL